MAPFGKQQEILRLLPEWPKAQLAAMVAVTKLEEQASDSGHRSEFGRSGRWPPEAMEGGAIRTRHVRD